MNVDRNYIFRSMIEPTNLFVKLRPTPSGEGSVEDHIRITREHGSVWWGRWSSARASRAAIVEQLNDQVSRGLHVSLVIRNSLARREYSARILQLEPPTFVPPAHLTPRYRNEPQVDMWLRVANFVTLPEGWISNHCVYATGKLEGQAVHYRGTQSLQCVAVRP